MIAAKKRVYVKCAFCGKENSKKWCESEGFIIVKCSCGLTYPNPRLSINEINRLYNSQDISGVRDYLEIEKDNIKDFERRIGLINNFAKKRGKMLDVGCNAGTLIEVAQNHGWNCSGIDVNKYAISIAKKRGLNCTTQNFFKIKEKFDLITMNDLIEHLENPRAALIKANSLLNENGYIYISTPRGDSFICRFIGGKWLHRKPKQHIYIFTSDTITRMLEDAGFEVMHLSAIGRTRSINTVIKKLGSYNLSLSEFLDAVTPQFIKNLSISINPLDEIHIIARKK